MSAAVSNNVNSVGGGAESSQNAGADAAGASTNAGKSPKGRSPRTKSTKPSKPKVPSNHPPYIDMVRSAIGALKEKKGSSRAAILTYILQHYTVGSNFLGVGH